MTSPALTRVLHRRWLIVLVAVAALVQVFVVVNPLGHHQGPQRVGQGRVIAPGGQPGQGRAEGTSASAGAAPEVTTNAASVAVLAFGDSGYDIVTADGGVFTFGGAPFYGSAAGLHLAGPIVAAEVTPDGGGYWLVASDGGIFAFGDAQFDGSMGGKPINAPISGFAPMPDGRGYWEVARDGGVFAFGDAQFDGSMGDKHLNAPIVSMAAAPGGGGYWLAASDGGVFAYGTSTFLGSMGGQHLNAPVVGMSAAAGGHGYLLIADDGGIFAYGDATFYGSMGGTGLSAAVVGVAGSAGAGYWLLGANGAIYSFGNAQYAGRALSPVGGSPAPSGGLQPVGGPGGPWNLVFDSEFSGATLNASQWSTCLAWGCTNTGPPGSPELETYTAANCQLSGGVLNLVAEVGGGGARPYSSCALQTSQHYSFTYGYAEAQVWLPAGAGFWPGFWLLATNGSSDEIDAMEADGNLPDQAILTYHYGSGEFNQSTVSSANYTAGWHTFAVDWEPGSITWYVDGMAAKTFTSPVVATTAMYAILDLAVSGPSDWHSSPNASTPFPSALKVAYVRVWQH